MKVKPVIYYKAPSYPSGHQLQNHPKLLDRVPVRWAKNGLVLTALGMTMALCACAAGAPQGSGTMGESGEGNTPEGVAQGGKTMTAPVFSHGDGIGSYGCVSVTSPYFLSEEEAFEIIQSEARDYGGISFTAESGMTLPDMSIPETVINGEQPKKETTR